MGRPTFPARNQWNADAAQPAHPSAPRAVPRVPPGSGPLVPTLPVDASQYDRLAAVQQSRPAPVRTHVVPVQTRSTVGNTGLGNAAAMRSRMVQLLQAEGLQDARVVQAMLAVERHCFVDSALLNQAYLDTSLPIGLQQTISKPSVVARMIELLLSSPAMQRQSPDARLGRVLEVGTGCGYQASVLSQVASEVYSIERLKGLHEKARDNLRPFRIPNIHLLLGDGMQGFESGAPYAGIIAAAGGQAIPQAWVDQLAMGGRIVAPMATGPQSQVLVVLDKTANGLQQTVLEPVFFVPLKSGLA